MNQQMSQWQFVTMKLTIQCRGLSNISSSLLIAPAFQPTFVHMQPHPMDSIFKISTVYVFFAKLKKILAIFLALLLHGAKWPKYLLPSSASTMIQSILFWLFFVPNSFIPKFRSFLPSKQMLATFA